MNRVFIVEKDISIECIDGNKVTFKSGTQLKYNEQNGLFYDYYGNTYPLVVTKEFTDALKEVKEINNPAIDWINFRNDTAKIVLASLLTDREYMSKDYQSVDNKKNTSPQDRAALMAISYANALVSHLKSNPI